MSRCRHVQHLFSAYIDGDLPPARLRAVEAHVAVCGACARELEQWRRILRLVSYHASVTCPIDCSEAVLQRLETLHHRPSPVSYSPRPPFMLHLAVTVSVAALLGGGLWLGATRGTGPLASGRPAPIAGRPADRFQPTGASSAVGSVPLIVGYGPQTAQALRVHAPDRLQQALGRSDSLILAADFAEDDR